MPLSASTREDLGHTAYFLGRARHHGWRGAVAAGSMVGATIAVQMLVIHGTDGPRDTATTVLGTVVGFFAVATLAVSVSLTLLQTAAEMWPARVMGIFIEDRDRSVLLQTIYASFLVSLANLALLTADVIHPLLALVVPVLLAFLTLMLMVGYVFDRVRLFVSTGLIEEIDRRISRECSVWGYDRSDQPARSIATSGPSKADDARAAVSHAARLRALALVSDRFAVAIVLVDKGQEDDAEPAVVSSLQMLSDLIDRQASKYDQEPAETPDTYMWLSRSDSRRPDWQEALGHCLHQAHTATKRIAPTRGKDWYYWWVRTRMNPGRTSRPISRSILFDLVRAHLDQAHDHSEVDHETLVYELSVLGRMADALDSDSGPGAGSGDGWVGRGGAKSDGATDTTTSEAGETTGDKQIDLSGGTDDFGGLSKTTIPDSEAAGSGSGADILAKFTVYANRSSYYYGERLSYEGRVAHKAYNFANRLVRPDGDGEQSAADRGSQLVDAIGVITENFLPEILALPSFAMLDKLVADLISSLTPDQAADVAARRKDDQDRRHKSEERWLRSLPGSEWDNTGGRATSPTEEVDLYWPC